jgi:exodeoxyribonuclease VII large subunit
MQNSPIILSVSEITNAIKSQLEPMFRHIWVRGEVTNYRLQSSGHHYFALMEGGCQLASVMFRTAANSLTQPIKNGDTVVVEGEISVYAPRGSYQIVVRQLMHVGLGEALLKLKALKQKLNALGWFRPERKKPLPADIRTIGLVTSPTGAVLHDIINILTRRLGGFHLIVNPVRVQGEGAALQIAKAISEFNRFSLADVIIVCRGGGSTEDLAAFNEELVASACVESTIPIISAIGHETDLSITDLVADLRAPTPSAAAELVSQERTERRKRLSLLYTSAVQRIQQRLRSTASTLSTFQKRCDQSSPQKQVEFYALQIDDITSSLSEAIARHMYSKRQLLSHITRAVRQLAPTAKLAEQKSHLIHLEKALLEKAPALIFSRSASLSHMTRFIEEKMARHLISANSRFSSRDWGKDLSTLLSRHLLHLNQKLSALVSNLQALNPQRTLERGYAIVFRGNSKQVIRSVHTVAVSEHVTIMMADGTVSATADAINSEQRNSL